ncbi:MAG: ATP-binding protein [bacterium]|nr:ATP-binding protein [bacterium]
MKLIFDKKYKSIESFNEHDITDFSVFVGVNGSGKTHLLKAIKEGFVKADEIPIETISYFNFQTFLVKNQKEINYRKIDDDKLQAWNLLNNSKIVFEKYDKRVKALVGEVENPYTVEIPEEKKEEFKKIQKTLLNYINQIVTDGKIRKLLKTGIFESNKYASEMNQVEFFKFANYNPDDYELLESLSEIFLDYHRKIKVASLPKKEDGGGLDENQIEKLLEKSPWNFVNAMFKEFNLPHVISSPDVSIANLVNSQVLPFQAKLSMGGEEMDFEDLSSGEKILCALAITVYQDNSSEFPNLLLLDEIDASLHPSMIKNLLYVIEDVFLKKNCKVILATHSPTTSAIVPEDSLFEIQKGKVLEKIKKIPQSKAVDILGEGIMTLEKGLKIFDAIFKKELTIISEGKNQHHIKKAIEVLDKSLTEKIQLYEHDSGSGEADLFGLFEFIKKTDIQKKVLFVWDCDVKAKVDKRTDSAKVIKFCFEKNDSNTICLNGIENLYDGSWFTDDIIKTITITENGETVTSKIFSENNKNKFLEKIKLDNSQKTFINFQALIEKIKSLT